MIYQNIHCSKCHGVKNIWYWGFRTSCQGVLHEDAKIEDVVLSTDCDIINVVPEGKRSVTSKYLCYEFDLEESSQSDCNVSFIPGDIRKDLMTACGRNTWPYISVWGKNVKLYKNVFCYVCQFGFDSVYDVIDTVNTIQGPTFSALINYVDSLETKKNHHTHKCLAGQIYDSYMVSIFKRKQEGMQINV